MGLRYRLFLWISALFVAVAVCFYFVENRVTAYELKIARQQMRDKILEMNRERLQDLKEFVAETIAENIVRIDAILHNILRFSPAALRFSPININEEKGTWSESIDLLLEYKWINFLQNTAEDKVIALIAPGEMNAKTVFYQVPIQGSPNVFWVYVQGQKVPYLGVQVPYFLTTGVNTQERLEQIPGAVPVVVLLFDPEKISKEQIDVQKDWPAIPIKWTEGYALDVNAFAKEMQWVVQQMKESRLHPPAMTEEKLKEEFLKEKEEMGFAFAPTLLHSLPQEQLMQERLEEVGVAYTQLNLMWIWIALFETGILGEDLFSAQAPLGIGVFNEGKEVGFGIQGNKVLLAQSAFDDQAYYEAHKIFAKGPGIASSFQVIPLFDQLFLGNTAQFIVDVDKREKTGYLTLGTDANAFLTQMIFSLRKSVFLTYGDRLFGAYDENGGKIHVAPPSFATMKQADMGLVPWNDDSYFYMHIQPFADQDLHLFVLNPEKVEFSLLKSLDEGAQAVARAILFNIHLGGFLVLAIVIIILHNISKKITKPIVELAQATEHVAMGHYNQIELKGHAFNHHDEISQLYHSFQKMITGLQEKERVQGVLNKVVSTEIAQEILKGGVHLGGEERHVSVLFADIRGFTQMTQHKKANDVIELLNECMTKLSHIVDQHHGVIDKYVGDEVMALFGAPLPHPGDTLHAVNSALEMIRVLTRWNEERKSKGLEMIEVGIGIHTGTVCAGNMGAENRLNYTVIGRNVNLASRLCGAAKPMQILVSEQTLNEVKDLVVYEALTPMQFKGFDTQVPVYSILASRAQP